MFAPFYFGKLLGCQSHTLKQPKAVEFAFKAICSRFGHFSAESDWIIMRIIETYEQGQKKKWKKRAGQKVCVWGGGWGGGERGCQRGQWEGLGRAGGGGGGGRRWKREGGVGMEVDEEGGKQERILEQKTCHLLILWTFIGQECCHRLYNIFASFVLF